MHYPFLRREYRNITPETSAALYNDRCLFSSCNRNTRNSRTTEGGKNEKEGEGRREGWGRERERHVIF